MRNPFHFILCGGMRKVHGLERKGRSKHQNPSIKFQINPKFQNAEGKKEFKRPEIA
jgi:hypothetical protein